MERMPVSCECVQGHVEQSRHIAGGGGVNCSEMFRHQESFSGIKLLVTESRSRSVSLQFIPLAT